MERIIRHLEQLIIQHDYAILPEFGGFIINYVPAKVDENSQVVSAPHKEIFFNPALNYNDGLLAGAIQITDNVTFRKAGAIVSEVVEELKKRLKNGETVALGKIGSVRLDENGQIEFLAAATYDFLPDNLSNYNIRLGSLLKESDTQEIVVKIPRNRKRILGYAAALILMTGLAVLIPTLRTNIPHYFAKINPLNFLMSDTLAILDSMPEYSHLVVDTSSADYEHLIVDTASAAPANNATAAQQTGIPVTIVKTNGQPVQAQSNTPKATTNSKNGVKATKKSAPSAATPWHVIAGSYKTKAEAMAKAQELQRHNTFRGAWLFYSPRLQKSNFPIVAANTPVFAKNNMGNALAWHIVVANFETPKKAKRFIDIVSGSNKTPLAAYGSNNSYRVVASSFRSQQEALTKLKEIRKQHEFVSAWILFNPILLNYPVVQPAKQAATKPVAMAAKAQPKQEWHIVVANFETATYARKYAEQTAKKEKIALSVYGANGVYRVVAGSFAKQSDAYNAIKTVRQHPAFKSAWILKNANLQHSPVPLTQPATPKPTAKQATAATKPTAEKEGVPLLQKGVWYLVVANYYTSAQAQKYAETTARKEKIQLSVVKDNNLYRVVAGAYKDQNAASGKMKELHQHAAFAETWPLCKPAGK